MNEKLNREILNDPIIRHAHPDITAMHADQSVGEALNELRRQELSDRILYFYVVDKDERLIGVVPVRRLITGSLDEPVRSVMIQPVVSIRQDATVLDACEMFLEKRLLALPVVDEEGRLTGVVDIKLFTDEINALAEQHQVDNAFQVIGVHVQLGRKVAPWISTRDRFPWLLCNIASGVACAVIASRYELMIAQFTVLALFTTVVLALAESVSMQSMTITLQGLARKSVDLRQLIGTLGQELATATMLGGLCGTLVGTIALLWRGSDDLFGAVTIGGTIWLTIIVACLLGVIIPTTIRLLKADPKVAAGPIVLASADMVTILLYFNLAHWLLG